MRDLDPRADAERVADALHAAHVPTPDGPALFARVENTCTGLRVVAWAFTDELFASGETRPHNGETVRQALARLLARLVAKVTLTQSKHDFHAALAAHPIPHL